VSAQLTVVGIGTEGWDGLGAAARAAVEAATLIVGSERQLALLPETPAVRRRWPSPIEGLVEELVSGAAGPACILASGDPMLHGIGATLARRVAPERLTVHPHLSAFSLACARLGWAAADTDLLSAVSSRPEVVARLLQPGRRMVVYVAGRDGASDVAEILRKRGFGPSRFVVLEQLGGPDEQVIESTAEEWGTQPADPLHALAIECRASAEAAVLPGSPGLPDDAYEHDGQLTKHEVRAITMAALAPLPGQLLWDVGAGSGSIAIEWLRAEPTARAIAVEARLERAERVARNASTLGVPQLEVRCGEAPAALEALEQPDAIFIGGGLGAANLVAHCWRELRPGGRVVANAVTLQGELVLHAASATYGGRVTRIEISRAEPLGRYTAWRAQLPVVQWAASKERA